AAPVALEDQPVKFWQEAVLAGKGPDAVIAGVVALARQGDKSLQPKMVAALDQLLRGTLTESQVRDVLRAYSLVFIRTGQPDKETAERLAKTFNNMFPGPTDEVNREMAQVLVYLQSPTIVERPCDELQKTA